MDKPKGDFVTDIEEDEIGDGTDVEETDEVPVEPDPVVPKSRRKIVFKADNNGRLFRS